MSMIGNDNKSMNYDCFPFPSEILLSIYEHVRIVIPFLLI